MITIETRGTDDAEKNRLKISEARARGAAVLRQMADDVESGVLCAYFSGVFNPKTTGMELNMAMLTDEPTPEHFLAIHSGLNVLVERLLTEVLEMAGGTCSPKDADDAL